MKLSVVMPVLTSAPNHSFTCDGSFERVRVIGQVSDRQEVEKPITQVGVIFDETNTSTRSKRLVARNVGLVSEDFKAEVVLAARLPD